MTEVAETTIMNTAAQIVMERLGDEKIGIYFRDETITWDSYARAAIQMANLFDQRLETGQPRHIGILMANRPEYLVAFGAAALSGAVLVCLNSTRRGQELAGDVDATDCQFVLFEEAATEVIRDLNLSVPTYNVDATDFHRDLRALDDQTPPDVPEAWVPSTIVTMQFTSGSTGRPKAVMCSTGRFAYAGAYGWQELSREDVAYNAMPLFHSNALLSSWARMLYLGGGFALAPKFSASGFLPDLLRYKANFFNYTGRVLSYILAQPERPEEKDNVLKYVFGTEATLRDRKEFARRYGVEPTESYGSSEGGLNLVRTPDTPENALGVPPPGVNYEAAVVDPLTFEERPRARFGPNGDILNKSEAIGELVALNAAASFEGYYKAEADTAERTRGGHFCTGDLGYRDEDGFFYFAGRMGDRFRVDGENFSAAPIERIIGRYTPAILAAVYPVPDAISGDQVMLALQMENESDFDPVDFAQFLEEQPDLGTKWVPKYVRIVTALPVTATNKINKPALRKDRWHTDDPVYIREGKTYDYQLVDSEIRKEIYHQFVKHGREGELDD